MNKTRIEWVDYTLNPVKGLCPMACPYCYAIAMYKRFKWNPEIRFEWNFTPPKKPSKIFVGSTIELFGEWVPDSWLRNIFNFCSQWPEHTFLFLTKQPQNLIKFSPFPDNCWVGVTATNHRSFAVALNYLWDLKATTKYISFEPLLGPIPSTPRLFLASNANISWLIIGAQTRPTVYPKIEWVEEIVVAADKAGIPVFLKDNLKPLFKGIEEPDWMVGWDNKPGEVRQEMPR